MAARSTAANANTLKHDSLEIVLLGGCPISPTWWRTSGKGLCGDRRDYSIVQSFITKAAGRRRSAPQGGMELQGIGLRVVDGWAEGPSRPDRQTHLGPHRRREAIPGLGLGRSLAYRVFTRAKYRARAARFADDCDRLAGGGGLSLGKESGHHTSGNPIADQIISEMTAGHAKPRRSRCSVPKR